MPDQPAPGYSVIFALLLLIVASIWLGTLAQRRIEKKSFLSGFFLGNRGLGAWTMALTATVQSGGTFMGFPALVYSHGWVVALWIGGYMVVPLTGFAVVGKRFAQLSRRSGAITVPDIFRERFGSPQVGLVASLLILVFMSSMMIAQFKAGAIVMKLAWPGTGALALAEDLPPAAGTEVKVDAGDASNVKAPTKPVADKAAPATNAAPTDWPYLIGLGLFAVAVVGYTLVGGFLASVWTDMFQSVMMVIGVMIFLFLALPASGGLEKATHTAIENTGPAFASGPGYYKDPERQFMTPGLAVSFFFVWVMAGIGSPASMVRVMATQSTEVLRKSVFLLSCYNCLIYIPLIMVFICARSIIPSLEQSQADEIVPRLALKLTSDISGGGLLTGLILAAPFGAVMATVSCYLLVIASGLVKDIYLRFIRPNAEENEIKRVTRVAMILVGILAVGANIQPVRYLQALVIFSGAGAAATFVVPALMLCYWRRATAAGALAGMITGGGSMFVLFAGGWLQRSLSASAAAKTLSPMGESILNWLGTDPKLGIDNPFGPFLLWGLDPIIWSLFGSLVMGVLVSLLTKPPGAERVALFFDPPAAIPKTAAAHTLQTS